ncbi:hypothetical protein [Ovoidimarina sediminis]|uniref:hypothetical protein n=1 Tax=Ovoidimarina sediminis TaxID=3079856 RepID=UPI00290FF0E2|nr:hypothetical protein [Rhodophyticola sp. MJ-SS7]MDU8946751.1 hypothetical protein [Rhodophyticola sp. MJ-SS7]
MQVIFHIGAHCTGQDRLMRSLLKNRDVLAQNGVAVPGPGRYRRILAEVLKKLRGAPASAETQDVLLEAVLDLDDADRVILSNESFICAPSKAVEGGVLYPKIDKSAWLAAAFPEAEVEFALSLRNMASFLPALFEIVASEDIDAHRFLGGQDPRELTWVSVVEGLRAANPEAPILVWCDEDSPLLWPEIMRELAGLDALVRLEGENDLARTLLSREGNAKLDAYVGRRPPEDEAMRRRVVASFLSNYGEDSALEQEIDLPGWTDALIDELTAAYDEDVERIASIPRVTVLTP